MDEVGKNVCVKHSHNLVIIAMQLVFSLYTHTP